MADTIDKEEELNRLNEEISRLENEIHRISNKLNNDGFVSKAPAATIEKEKLRLASFEKDQNIFREQVATLMAS